MNDNQKDATIILSTATIRDVLVCCAKISLCQAVFHTVCYYWWPHGQGQVGKEMAYHRLLQRTAQWLVAAVNTLCSLGIRMAAMNTEFHRTEHKPLGPNPLYQRNKKNWI